MDFMYGAGSCSYDRKISSYEFESRCRNEDNERYPHEIILETGGKTTSQPVWLQVSRVGMQQPRDLLFQIVIGKICVQISLFVYSSERLFFLQFKITKTIPHGKEIRGEGGNDFLKLLFLSMRQIFHRPSKQPITHHKFLSFKTNSPDNTGQWFPNQF